MDQLIQDDARSELIANNSVRLFRHYLSPAGVNCYWRQLSFFCFCFCFSWEEGGPMLGTVKGFLVSVKLISSQRPNYFIKGCSGLGLKFKTLYQSDWIMIQPLNHSSEIFLIFFFNPNQTSASVSLCFSIKNVVVFCIDLTNSWHPHFFFGLYSLMHTVHWNPY